MFYNFHVTTIGFRGQTPNVLCYIYNGFTKLSLNDPLLKFEQVALKLRQENSRVSHCKI